METKFISSQMELSSDEQEKEKDSDEDQEWKPKLAAKWAQRFGRNFWDRTSKTVFLKEFKFEFDWLKFLNLKLIKFN